MLLPLMLQAVLAPSVVVPAPPAPSVIRSVAPLSSTVERFVVDVDIRAGSETLWSGPLRVASNTASTFSRSQSEPRGESCAEDNYLGVQSSLNVQLTPSRQYQSGRPVLGVTVRWSRPVESACPLRGAARTVELSDSVALAAGQSATVTGDGGLVVRLRRR